MWVVKRRVNGNSGIKKNDSNLVSEKHIGALRSDMSTRMLCVICMF
jgi:hypothetical protein